jgi:histone-lysine N-methyltransferase SETMAR
LLIDFLHERRTVNAAYYCQLLDNVKAAYKTKRRDQPITNVILLHDNARPHTAVLTRDKLKEFHWETLEHPPYSLDLSPSDYHLFGPLKEALGRHRFQSDDGVEEFVRNWAVTRPATFYEEGVQKLPTRWQ